MSQVKEMMGQAPLTLEDFVPDATLAESTSAQTSVRGHKGWRVIVAKVRLDALNQAELVRTIEDIRASGCQQIALDMKGNRFLSVQVIRYLVSLGADLAISGGRLALIAPVEKTKRHLEIYGSLQTLAIVRSMSDLTDHLPPVASPPLVQGL